MLPKIQKRKNERDNTLIKINAVSTAKSLSNNGYMKKHKNDIFC